MESLKAMFDLTGRKALVTGSSRGIGRAIALGLAEYGADVAIHYVGARDKAESAASECQTFSVKAPIVQGDLGEPDAPDRVFREAVGALGRIDILVHNVSIQIQRDWHEIPPAEFDHQIATNLRSGFRLMQLAGPPMAERGWGRIVSIGSVQQVRPHSRMAVYAAGKCGMASIVRNLAKQLGPSGVTVNNVAPGVIQTDRNAEAAARQAYRKGVNKKIPLGRWGRPIECAPMVVLLCAEAGSYITGADIYVDGGMSL